jgi:23S rRNA (adenine2503-C2)-methyltransferase
MKSTSLIFDLDLSDLTDLLVSWGELAYRSKQIWQGLYHQFWTSPDQFSALPQKLRERLAENFQQTQNETQLSFNSLSPTTVLDSSDGETRKTLFLLPDHRPIEAVLMRYSDRRTLCISTQSGCAMGCVFCATGQMGFGRNLSSGEIVEQVLYYARLLAAQSEVITNVVVMGMGEPFHNYDATLTALERLSDPEGMNLGARRFTISTVGLTPAIRKFAARKSQINLAVSLHAANDELRSSMLPINKKYPLSDLIDACREYISLTHRRISFEWALISGVNDTPDQARQLVELLKPLRLSGRLLAHINAIPLNPTSRFNKQAASRQRALAFQNELEKLGVPCTIRLRRGIDIQAGCGQLAGANLNLPRSAQIQILDT